MKSILRKTGVITLLSFWALIITYTGAMGFIFSFMGMWQDDTNLMIGYAITFLVFGSSFIYLILKTKVFDRALG